MTPEEIYAEFNGIVFDNWTPVEMMSALHRETAAAQEFLDQKRKFQP
jgi:hypothetical protein